MKRYLSLILVFVMILSMGISMQAAPESATVTQLNYLVIYTPNGATGGSVPVDSNAYITGDIVTVLGSSTLTRDGYIFAGWCTNADGSGITYSAGSTLAIGYNSVLLYARWLKTPVTGLTALSASYNSIKLTWSAAAGAQHYQVYRATSLAGKYSYIRTLTATARTYLDTSLTTNQLYYYKVRAYAWMGTSNVFSNFSTVAFTKPIPSTPTNFIVKSASYNSIKLTWHTVAGANGYKIYRSIYATTGYTLIKTITSGSTASYLNSGLTTGKTYYYMIKAYHVEGTTNIYSNYTAYKSAKPVPAITSHFTAGAASSTSVIVSWTAVSGASGYEISRATGTTGSFTWVKTVTATSYLNTGLIKGQVYSYKVRAYRLVNGVKVYGALSALSALRSATPTIDADKIYNNGEWFVQQGDWIYFTINMMQASSQDWGLYRMKQDGTLKTKLSAGHYFGTITIAGDWIYFVKNSHIEDGTPVSVDICKIKKDGTSQTRLLTLNGFNIEDMQIVSNWIYFGGRSTTGQESI
jgi:fibronectin type 3 domain-containing protein